MPFRNIKNRLSKDANNLKHHLSIGDCFFYPVSFRFSSRGMPKE